MPISFRGWIDDFKDNWEESKQRALMQALYCAYLSMWFTASSRLDPGENVLDHDWDLLLILDACRVDALQEVADEYEWLPDHIDSEISRASGSFEFMVKTFSEQYLDKINDTAYISANGFVERAFVNHEYAPSVNMPFGWPKQDVVQDTDFHRLDMLWKFRHVDRLACVPPRSVTDETIAARREDTFDKCIAHYAQPHAPYPARAIDEDREVNEIERKPLKSLKYGDASREEVWELYLDNLRGVLDDVELLLNNYDADNVLITADHGESLGEFGVHGHPTGWPHPVVKKVPWVWVDAKDNETHEPETIDSEGEETGLEKHLRDLGYRT